MHTANFDVVLNKNAGSLTESMISQIQAIVPKERVHLTTSLLHSRDVIKECMDRGTETIFAGGGDGTIVDVVNTVTEFSTGHTPTIGVLRLGTGNALASWLHSGNPVDALQQWTNTNKHKVIQANMIEAEDTLFPFAGVGLDAAVLNDYNLTKRNAKGTWLQPFLKGFLGYLWAGCTRTLPNFRKTPNYKVQIINLGRPAFRIGPNGGEIGEAIPTGATLYEGEVSTVTCGTSPYYGYKMKMFPFATNRQGRFQLRVVELTPLQVALNIYGCWKGEFRHPGLIDFYADRVRVIFEEAAPYQLGGEACGYRKDIVFSLGSSVNMIEYT